MIERTAIIHDVIWSLRSKGISDQDIFDLLFTLVFWKYISDKSIKDEFLDKKLLFDKAILLRDSTIEQSAETALHEWARNYKNIEVSYWVNKQTAKQLGEDDLRKLCLELKSFFSNDWDWEKGNMMELFNNIESLFANSINSAHLFLTPPDVSKLISKLLIPGKKDHIYDPFCRYGELLSESIYNIHDVKMATGNAISLLSKKIATLKSIMLDFPLTEINYQTIYSENNVLFDTIVSNPPFGGKMEKIYHNGDGWLKNFGGLRQELDFLCHVLDHLNENGQAIVVVPLSILSSTGKILHFRQQLIRVNWVEAIVTLPSKIFYGTGAKTAILLINRKKTNKDVFLVNAQDLGERQRDRYKFSKDDITYLRNIIISIRQNKKLNAECDKICVKVTLRELEQKNFDLQFMTYKNEESDNSSNMRSSIVIWKEVEKIKMDLKSCHEEISAIMEKR